MSEKFEISGEVTEEINEENKNTVGVESASGLDQDFEDFEKKQAEFSAKVEKPVSENAAPSPADIFKVRMFIGFAFTLLSGFHAFVYSKISKLAITSEDMSLNEFEKKSLEPYFMSPEILVYINKLHPGVWLFLHVEYTYFMKFEMIKKLKEVKTETNTI